MQKYTRLKFEPEFCPLDLFLLHLQFNSCFKDVLLEVKKQDKKTASLLSIRPKYILYGSPILYYFIIVLLYQRFIKGIHRIGFRSQDIY